MDARFDSRDSAEHEAVRSILAALPPKHPAWLAYNEDHATTIELTHLVGDWTLIERLKEAHLAGLGRVWDRVGHFRP